MAFEDTRVTPRIGQWYLDRVSEQQFKVVALDGDAIDLQYLGGDVTEFDADDWRGMDLALSEAPEDWSGALERVEDGDGGYDPESFEPPADQHPPSGFGQDQVLLADEGEIRKASGATGPSDEEG